MDFDELWEKSKAFRSLFIGNGRILEKRFNKKKAKALWDARFPELEWDLCGWNGCNRLVVKGENCGHHSYVSGKMPLWAWNNGILYRYLFFNLGAQKMFGSREYRPYHKFVASKKFGDIPHGYTVFFKDKNIFNCHQDNLLLLSRISSLAVSSNILTLQDAIELDLRIGDFIHEKVKDGRRPFYSVFGYGDISSVAGMSQAALRKEVTRGNLDPENLASIVEFVNCKKTGDNEEEIDVKAQA